MTQAPKARRLQIKGPRRREPTPVDYNDEISDKTLAEIQKVASSKDDPQQRWEIVRGPAW